MTDETWNDLQKPPAPPISWKTICEALGTEYREHTTIQGASGVEHSVQAIGVDEPNKRLLVVSAEFNPRIAAMMRIDLQATMPGTRVIVARPVGVDIAHMAKSLFLTAAGMIDFPKVLEFQKDITNPNETLFNEKYGPAIQAMIMSATSAPVPLMSLFVQFIQQGSMLNWQRLLTGDEDIGVKFQNAVVDLLSMDTLAADIQHGICPIPTYEFSEADWDLFSSKGDVEGAVNRLKELNIHQYFYPPADTLALGIIDRGFSSRDAILDAVNVAEQEGHRVAASTLVPDAGSIIDILEELRSVGYLADVNIDYDLTSEGKTVRSTLKARPAEGLISKLISRLNFNIDISTKDLISLGRGKGSGADDAAG